MRKLLILFGLMVTMVACTGNSTSVVSDSSDSDSIVMVDSVDSTLIDTVAVN